MTTIDGQPIEPLAAETKEPYRALFAGRVPRLDGHTDSPLIVERLREVGAGIQEQVTHRNFSNEPAECVVSLKVEADFADLFEVKDARIQRRWDQTCHVNGDTLTIRAAWQDVRKGILIQAPGADITPEGLGYRVTVAPHSQWSSVITAVPSSEATSPPRRRRSFILMQKACPQVTAADRDGWRKFPWSAWETARLNGRCDGAMTTSVPFASKIQTIRTV